MWAEEISDRGFAIAPEAVQEWEIESLVAAPSASIAVGRALFLEISGLCISNGAPH
jgi:hypothetical protein